MVSAIDATKPIDGIDASKADLRANLLTAKNEITALQEAVGSGGGDIAVEDDNVAIVAIASTINFTGAGVVVTDAGSGQANVAIAGAGESTLVIEDENVAIVSPTARINFTGAGVTVANAGSGEATVTIPGGGGGGGTATDGITLVEGTDFTAGGTFTVDPGNALHRHIKVWGAVANGNLLTNNMTVTVAPADTDWGTLKGQDATVVVEKADTSAFTVTMLGEGAAGTGTRVLRVRDQWAAMVRRTGPGGPGPLGEMFAAITGGAASRQSVQELLVAGYTGSPTSAAIDDLVPIYTAAGVWKGVAPAAALPIPATGSFNPAAVLVDAPRQYTQYTQTGAVTFTKSATGTFRGNVLQEVLFSSNGAALTWTSDFEDYSTLDNVDLPATLPTGLHRIVLVWSAVRSKIGVSFPRVLAEQINGELNGVIFGRASIKAATAQTGVIGALTVNRVNGLYHHVTHGSGNISGTTVQNWDVGAFCEVLLDVKQDAVGGRTFVPPTGTVWIGGTPTFDTAANKTNRMLLTTANNGTSVQAEYHGAY